MSEIIKRNLPYRLKYKKCCIKNCRDWEGVRNMSKSVNKVILVGNLTRDPELKQMEGKKSLCVFGLATNRSRVNEAGEKHEEPEFHRIVAWDKLAEVCNQYLKKGRKVFVEGRLQYRTYTGQDGLEKFSAEIVLEDMTMLDSMPKMPKEAKETLESSNVPQL
jgi:single-strand DNA-binding protein